MKLLPLLILSAVLAQDYIPAQYTLEAKEYYASLDSAQWEDVEWHYHYFGIRNAVFAGMEGSNRPTAHHGDEDSHQDTGIYYPTARLYAPDITEDVLRESLKSHFYCSSISAAVDKDNIGLELRRGSIRPYLNAAQRYPGGKNWRNRKKYGLVFMSRVKVLKEQINKVGRLD